MLSRMHRIQKKSQKRSKIEQNMYLLLLFCYIIDSENICIFLKCKKKKKKKEKEKRCLQKKGKVMSFVMIKKEIKKKEN